MPDPNTLKPGDRIRLLRVPDVDLQQRERELRQGPEQPGLTADTIERILRQNPVVTIGYIDDTGLPWFEYELERPDGAIEYHSLAIFDDESWEMAG